MIVCKSIS